MFARQLLRRVARRAAEVRQARSRPPRSPAAPGPTLATFDRHRSGAVSSDVNALARSPWEPDSPLTSRVPHAQASASRAYIAAPEMRAGSLARLSASEAAASRPATARAPVAFGFAAATLATFAPAATAACAEAGEATASAAAPASAGGAAAHPTVVFVLGGPGAGKGTQCANIVRDFGFTHLSAGDLLRAHMKSGSADGNMVAEMIKQGQIVPSEVTVNLLLGAMKDSGKSTFLIDGFPRNKENRDAWERTAGYDCDFVLFFDCPEDVMLQRLLGRNEGRTDDNVETIKKRFKTFQESSMPVVQYYEGLGKVRSVAATASPEAVYADTEGHFAKFK
jgi:UMP-CMP kinase